VCERERERERVRVCGVWRLICLFLWRRGVSARKEGLWVCFCGFGSEETRTHLRAQFGHPNDVASDLLSLNQQLFASTLSQCSQHKSTNTHPLCPACVGRSLILCFSFVSVSSALFNTIILYPLQTPQNTTQRARECLAIYRSPRGHAMLAPLLRPQSLP
jgi:hypothetical protein